MPGSGSTVLDFGTHPGSDEAEVVVTGQAAITATSLVEAQVRIAPTTGAADSSDNHSLDEHLVENLRVRAGSIVAGTGFTVYGLTEGPCRLKGRWNVDWVWA